MQVQKNLGTTQSPRREPCFLALGSDVPPVGPTSGIPYAGSSCRKVAPSSLNAPGLVAEIFVHDKRSLALPLGAHDSIVAV